MGKREGRKKRKLKYSRSQFGDIICSACQLCELLDPNFCYSQYKADPKTFMDHTYGKLRNPALTIKPIQDILTGAFCVECGSIKPSPSKVIKCKDYAKCMDAFRLQLQGIQAVQTIQFERKFKKKNKKKKKKYICAAYPTFFSSEGWKDEIRDIVDGDKTNEQHRSETSSGSDQVGVDKTTQDNQSEVSGSH